ncbi:uncharacterized protein LOC128128443 [Lactuca sativa]|uniref:uncharacterized protein LOC128128443 n=1 Tax=Lactuca sativa TaxID=4236 RepID=UPI0022AF873C|nr:uncharacterized protein LOC128128443 [Lactuca sativa]
MKAVPSTYHQCVKISTPWGTVKVMGVQQESKECYKTSMKSTTKPQQASQLRQGARHVLEKKEQDVKEVPLGIEDLEAKALIGSSMPEQIERDLLNFLRTRSKTFAWKHEDMTDQYTKKEVNLHPERNQIIQKEVEKHLKTGMIKEVKFPRWLANVVVIQKNGKWRVCVDYTDLSKACPKDPFCLPHIDSVIDAITSHELLTFMDASA